MKHSFKIDKYGSISPHHTVNIRCPECNVFGSFLMFKDINDLTISSSSSPVIFGQRQCPNIECHSHIFIILENNEIRASYPASRIDFDTNSIPPKVVASLQEAIMCHSNNCFIAAAIMVRKALEEFCSDCGSEGKNLYEKILNLRDLISLPHELFEAIDDLRLLGNDAAHIESRVFSKVGKEEVELSILFTKEVLKAKYQYVNLLTKFRELKASN